MNYYYKILMNLHRKTTTKYRPFLLPPYAFHFTQSNAKHRVGDVASTNHTEKYWTGLDEIYDDNNKGMDRSRWSRSYAQAWLRA
jgi:hypothetical protein